MERIVDKNVEQRVEVPVEVEKISSRKIVERPVRCLSKR